MGSDTPALELLNITKTYQIRRGGLERDAQGDWLARFFLGRTFSGRVKQGWENVLNGVSLEARLGGVVGLVGPNGSGKTTLLRIASGLLLPDGGEIRVFGEDARATPAALSRQVFPPMERGLINALWTGRQTIEYLAPFVGISERQLRDRLPIVLDELGLASRFDDMTMRYSTGMARRFSLVLPLVCDSPIVVLDEPLLGIDPVGAQDLRRRFRAMAADEGRLLLVATNIVDDAFHLVDRLVVLQGGVVAATGTARELVSLSDAGTVVVIDGRPRHSACEIAERLRERVATAPGSGIECCGVDGIEAGGSAVRCRFRLAAADGALSWLLTAVDAALAVERVSIEEPTLVDGLRAVLGRVEGGN